MEQLNIYTLLMAIRGLSNEITVRALSDQLGISYSTLARCKSGKWPRSITQSAMRNTLVSCRDRFFDGNGDALAQALLVQLHQQEIDVSSLEDAWQTLGFDKFVDELLVRAANPHAVVISSPIRHDSPQESVESQQGTMPHLDTHAHKTSPPQSDASSTEVATSQAIVQTQAHAPTPSQDMASDKPVGHSQLVTSSGVASDPSTKSTLRAQPTPNSYLHEALIALPIAIILLIGILNMRLANLILWAAENRVAFFAVSLLIAVSPALSGICIDAPLAWHAYHKDHPKAQLSLASFAHVAKFGDIAGIRPGAGRFNLTAPFVTYQTTCNVCGMLCYVSLLSFLLTLPEFITFFGGHEWTEYFKAGIVVAYFIAYGHWREQTRRDPFPNSDDALSENPDNYLPTRCHAWANTFHLTWTLSLLIVLLLSLCAYSIMHARELETPALMLWPYAHSMLFFGYSCVSQSAARIKATSVGILVPSVAATSAGFVILVLTCYLPSWGEAALLCACSLCTGGSFAWIRLQTRKTDNDWVRQNTHSSVYGITMAVAILVLLILGFVTSAFL